MTSMPAGPVRSYRVSVGHLAAFVHRHGDLGASGQPRVKALEGLRRQQRHQADDGRLATEVRLTGDWEGEGVQLRIAGRADGIRRTPERVRIEEIKTFRGDASTARTRAGAMHDAQVRLYGALWLAAAREGEEPVPELALRVLYLDADGETVHPFDVDADPEALDAFLDRTCRAYARWLEAERRHGEARDAALAGLPFPRGCFRPGQRLLARGVWQTLTDGGVLLVQAPTGIGKTLGVVYAALRRLPGLEAERVLYLTARGSGRRSALAAAGELNAAGAGIRTLELIARERICPVPGTPCHADACDRARGHHDRSRAAVAELLGHDLPGETDERNGIIDSTRVGRVADAHRVCPAALQHEAARFADLVVGDYNYGFDPFARQRALTDPDDGGAVVLADEAHNLVDRTREMHSAELSADRLAAVRARARSLGGDWGTTLQRLCEALEACDADPAGAPFERLVERAEQVTQRLAAWLGQAPAGGATMQVQDLLGDLTRFIEVAAHLRGSEGAAWRLIRDREDGATRIRLRCLSPAPRVRLDAQRCAALVLFSATLSPAGSHRHQLGLTEAARSLVIPCPFPAERRLLLRVDDLDLRARERGTSLAAVAGVVRDLVAARPGHYLVFGPSHDYLAALDAELALQAPGVERILQARSMAEDARRSFVETFARPDGRSRIGLAVCGGLFAEGIDLPGDARVGVVIAGVPVPAPDVERRALQDYHGGRGFEVAYRIPAMTRVLQAAGRLIRTENDAGVVCLVDARFARADYAALLPEHWRPVPVTAAGVGPAAGAFWARLTSSLTPSV
jgi:DNA excision repair protein ERCC-2